MNINKQMVECNTRVGTLIQSEVLKKLLICLGFAALTGISAQIKWYVPGNPIPFTMQTAAVALSALSLKRWAGMSQLFYVVLGVLGVPWFSNQAGGLSFLLLPSAGYLIGFIFTAFIGGWFVEKYYTKLHVFTFLPLTLINVLFVHGFGMLYLNTWMIVSHQPNVSFAMLFIKGSLPFLWYDLGKILLVTGLYPVKE